MTAIDLTRQRMKVNIILKKECDRISQTGHRRISWDNIAYSPWASSKIKHGYQSNSEFARHLLNDDAGEAKNFAWCCSSWAFAFEVNVNQCILRVFVHYFLNCVAYSSISTSNFFDLTWYRLQTEQNRTVMGKHSAEPLAETCRRVISSWRWRSTRVQLFIWR